MDEMNQFVQKFNKSNLNAESIVEAYVKSDSYKDNNEFINIYCYSRDLEGADYWLTMKKKPVKKSKKNHKKSKES